MKETYDNIVKVRITNKQKEQLDKLVLLENETLSEVMREALDNYVLTVKAKRAYEELSGYTSAVSPNLTELSDKQLVNLYETQIGDIDLLEVR